MKKLKTIQVQQQHRRLQYRTPPCTVPCFTLPTTPRPSVTAPPKHLNRPSERRHIVSTVAARKEIEEKSNEFNGNGG